MSVMKRILLENNEVKIELEDGIVIANWKTSFVDINVARRAVKYRLECTNYVSYPLLSNIKSIKHGTKEARDFLALEKSCEGIIAAAVLINSDIGSMIGNFFIKINKPSVLTKLFTDEMDAKKWLAQFVKKD